MHHLTGRGSTRPGPSLMTRSPDVDGEHGRAGDERAQYSLRAVRVFAMRLSIRRQNAEILQRRLESVFKVAEGWRLPQLGDRLTLGNAGQQRARLPSRVVGGPAQGGIKARLGILVTFRLSRIVRQPQAGGRPPVSQSLQNRVRIGQRPCFRLVTWSKEHASRLGEVADFVHLRAVCDASGVDGSLLVPSPRVRVNERKVDGVLRAARFHRIGDTPKTSS